MCRDNGLTVLGVRRVHLELFARWMEGEGRMPSTVARRLSTLATFYRYCHAEGLLARDPAANVRRPKVDHESRTLGLDRKRSRHRADEGRPYIASHGEGGGYPS
jgi:integrase/recombinase XerD